MEHLSAPAQGFLEGRCADRHDHELLGIDGVGCVGTAVQDVHHGNRQTVAGNTAQEAVERNIQRKGCCAGRSDRNSQDGVCTQVGFILGAVCLDHGSIDSVNIGSIHAGQNIIDGGVDVLHSLLHTLAAVTGFVAIAQLQGFKFARRCAGRCHAAANGAVSQPDLSFNGGVSAGVQNFAAYNFFNFQVCHYRSILSLGNYLISSEHCSND